MEDSATSKENIPTVTPKAMNRVLAQNYLEDTIEKYGEEEAEKPNAIIFDYKVDSDFF